MNIFTQLTTSIVAIVSILLSIYTLYFTKRKSVRELHSRYIEKIVDKRIASYPDLWSITSMAFWNPKHDKEVYFSKEWASEFYQKLYEWYYAQGHGIFMNEDSKIAFSSLHSALFDFDPEKGRDSVKEAASKLRQELRADLKLEKRIGESTDM